MRAIIPFPLYNTRVAHATGNREQRGEVMRTNHVRRRLAAGEPSIGTWLSLPSPEAAEYVSKLNLDWLVVDAEHNPADIRTLAQMFMAMGNSSIAPLVRIPWNAPENFKRVLDAGAWGIVVPMVNTREEAERAVAAMRYTPLGNRSVGGGRHALSFETTAKDYYAAANDELLLVLQIEHIKGVENADEILSVPGVDACFIGAERPRRFDGYGARRAAGERRPAHGRGAHACARGLRPAWRRDRHPLFERGGGQPARRRRLSILRDGERTALPDRWSDRRPGDAELAAR
jgi:hypothetical protein